MKKTPLKRKTPMKRTGFKKKTILDLLAERIYPKPLSQLSKPRKRFRQVSAKRQKDNKEYTRLRKEFLLENPRCQLRGCDKPSTQIHHTGRRGKHLNNVSLFMAVCARCHTFIEENGEWAKEMGYTLTVQKRRLLG